MKLVRWITNLRSVGFVECSQLDIVDFFADCPNHYSHEYRNIRDIRLLMLHDKSLKVYRNFCNFAAIELTYENLNFYSAVHHFRRDANDSHFAREYHSIRLSLQLEKFAVSSRHQNSSLQVLCKRNWTFEHPLSMTQTPKSPQTTQTNSTAIAELLFTSTVLITWHPVSA